MKKIFLAFLFFIHSVFILSCNESNPVNLEGKQTPVAGETKTSAKNIADLQAPDLTDPGLKKYFGAYNEYLKKVVVSIRNKDEAATMKIFREEGKQWDNKNEMEEKARANSTEEQKYTSWLRETIPYQSEIAQSEYYKKYNEEYYKKVKEDFEKKKN